MKQRIVFFGSGYYVIPIVEKLLKHNLLLVVTTEIEGKFIQYLKTNNIPFLQSKLKSEEDIKKIVGLTPTLGILASYGAIIPKKIIDLFPLGILNIHPSLLPKYKGPSPVQFTILNGETSSGTTIIKLDDKVDHGPILAQDEIELDGKETLQTLTKKLFLLGSDMIIKVVHNIENGLLIEEKQQVEKNESWTKKVSRQDGRINLENLPERTVLSRKIRAFYPWPGVYLTASLAGSQKLIKLLPEGKIQVEGKKPMSYKDFINGYFEGKNIIDKLGL